MQARVGFKKHHRDNGLNLLGRQSDLSIVHHATLRVLATTDLHMHILPYDYTSGQARQHWGLVNTARLIHDARKEVRNSVLLDNGDFLHGTAMGDMLSDGAGHLQDQAHPMIAAMDHLRYDAATVGNHDFDRGVAPLMQAIEQASFPIVSANVVEGKGAVPTKDSTLLPPFTMLSRYVEDPSGAMLPIKIGILGLLPPDSLSCTSQAAPAPGTRDIVETARSYVPEMRRLGADLVIVLAHSGIGGARHQSRMENALLPLSHVPGIDAIIGGHSHQIFPEHNGIGSGQLNDVPTVIPGFWGSHLGVIDLNLSFDDGAWNVDNHLVELRSVLEETGTETRNAAGGIPQLDRILDDLHRSTLNHLSTPIGHSKTDLNNYFSLLGADTASQLLQELVRDYCKELPEHLNPARLPLLVSAGAFKTGGLAGPDYYTSIERGDLTLRALSDLYLFPNELRVIEITGADLRVWLERAASVFQQVLPGEKRVLLKDDQTPGYLLEHVSGVEYAIDLTVPTRDSLKRAAGTKSVGRIRDLTYLGHAVQNEDQFLLATNDFRARGGGGYPVFSQARVLDVDGIKMQDLLRSALEKRQVIDLVPEPAWHFVTVKDASVVIKSSPTAFQVQTQYPWLDLTTICTEDEAGFAHYELAL